MGGGGKSRQIPRNFARRQRHFECAGLAGPVPSLALAVGHLSHRIRLAAKESRHKELGVAGDETSKDNQPDAGATDLRESIRRLPTTSGVYLMKDALGRVIYVGKAVNLRSRVGSYFNSAAAEDIRTANLVPEIRAVDFIETQSEVDALLLEARLIKDVQPRFNQELKDDKTFPYLEIRIREDFPRVEFTRKPRPRGTKLYGPFTNAKKLRAAIGVLQKIFRFRTCSLDIAEGDERWRWFRPCLLHSINQCTAPCNLRISREDYRRGIRRLILFLDGKKTRLLREMRREMEQASTKLKFEKAARIRDEIKSLENLDLCGKLDENVQPEVFYIDPKKGMAGLKKIFDLPHFPRRIEGVDIAHLQGGETVASLVQFIDGLPFNHGYKRYKIRTVQGVDDFASIREVVSRRFLRLAKEGESLPDILLDRRREGAVKLGGRGARGDRLEAAARPVARQAGRRNLSPG